MNRTPALLAPPCLTFNLLQYNKACLRGHSFTNLRLSVFSPVFSLSLFTFFYFTLRICPATPILSPLILPPPPHPTHTHLCREFVFQHPKQQSSLSIRKTEVMKRGLFSSDLLLVLGPSLLASHLLTLGVGWGQKDNDWPTFIIISSRKSMFPADGGCTVCMNGSMSKLKETL